MDKLQLITVFSAVADCENFSRAAKRLGLSAPTVTRAIAMLEQSMGTLLFTRTTRLVRLTEAGERFLPHAKRILLEVQEAEAAMSGFTGAPRGILAVTASALFGPLYVLPIILEYLRLHREVSVTSAFVDHVVNLVKEDFDVGVRIGRLPDSSLRAIQVLSLRRILCASPAYLRQHGQPEKPEDLLFHQVIGAGGATSEWTFGTGNAARKVRVHSRLVVSGNDAAVAAAAQGFGIARVISYQATTALAAGNLEPVLVAYEPSLIPVHVIHRHGRTASPKVRRFVDLAVERLRSHPELASPTS